MSASPNQTIRKLVSDALLSIDRENGGRYMSAVAAQVSVDRTTVGRWKRAMVTPSVDQCKRLAASYPGYFDDELLLRLHAQHALGNHGAELLTVGIRSNRSSFEVFEAARQLLEEVPADQRDREILLCALHLDHSTTDPITGVDPYRDQGLADSVQSFHTLMAKRAHEGWRVRVVVSAGNAARLPAIQTMLDRLPGPNVEIRAYARSLPLSICPLVIGRRDVALAFDDARTALPLESLMLRSPAAVTWATNYFDRLFLDAPYKPRGLRGVDPVELQRFRDAVNAQPA